MENTFYMRLYRTFHAQRGYLRSHLGLSGLGNGQPKLLVYLAGQGPCSQRQLAEYFEIDPAAVSRMLCRSRAPLCKNMEKKLSGYGGADA